jgi:hypothetical protein
LATHEVRVRIRSDGDVLAARQHARVASGGLGFGTT